LEGGAGAVEGSKTAPVHLIRLVWQVFRARLRSLIRRK